MTKIIIALSLTVALMLAAYMILISVSLAAPPVRPRSPPHQQKWHPHVHRHLPCVACVHLQRI
jgi:hypothetical protein